MELIHQIAPHLRRLRLSGMLETIEIRNRQAVADKISYIDFLAILIQDEVERRNTRQFERRLKKAGFSAEMIHHAHVITITGKSYRAHKASIQKTNLKKEGNL